MIVSWRFKKRDDLLIPGRPTRRLFMDGDISELTGRTVKLRIIAHGADVFSFRWFGYSVS